MKQKRVYATLKAVRKQQSDDQAALKTGEAALPELESSADALAESLKSAEQQTVKAKVVLKAEAPLIQKIRSLDQKLVEKKKAVSEGEARYKKDVAKINADKKARFQEQEKRAEAEKNLGLADGYLNEHTQDEWLIGGLAGVEEQMGVLVSKQKEIIREDADFKKAGTALERADKKFERSLKQSGIRKKELEGASKKLEQGKNALSELLGDRLLREYRTEKDTLQRESAFLSKIASLENHRAQLEDGKPCPLCGAKEHPFAKGNVPVSDETDKKIDALTALINKAEGLETANKKLEKAEADARKNLTDSEKREATAANDKKAAEKTLAELKDGLEKLQAGFAELKQAVAHKIQPLGITEIPDDDVSSLLESLRERQSAWQAQVKKKAQIEKQIAEIDSEVKRLGAVIETQSATVDEKQQYLEALKKEHGAESDERMVLYGDKKPDDEERRLNKAIAGAEAAEKKARTRHLELQQKLTTAKTNVKSLKKRIGQREPELGKAERDFSSALEPAGFSDEEQFLGARMPAEQRDMLSARATALDNGQTELKARQKDRETRLTRELSKKVIRAPAGW